MHDLQYWVSLGLGGVIFYFYRQEHKELLQIVRDYNASMIANTVALTHLSTVLVILVDSWKEKR